ncbi:hypothetical protein SLEP1_g6093 [Rubroshorea leprosula]|uniref:Uncharacterized protein n=1 Tax=Rubroshorea leprosula TaxID=152421 RepID=A0AAV5HZX6_9ROSI|nr:hypothetical protein SLEP1_g6093 [Rubroshorea leprosula]
MCHLSVVYLYLLGKRGHPSFPFVFSSLRPPVSLLTVSLSSSSEMPSQLHQLPLSSPQ